MRISLIYGGCHRTVEGYDRRKKEKKNYSKMQDSEMEVCRVDEERGF